MLAGILKRSYHLLSAAHSILADDDQRVSSWTVACHIEQIVPAIMYHHRQPGNLEWAECPIHVAAPVFFDIETSGLRPDRGAKITEVAIVDRSGLQFHWLSCHPQGDNSGVQDVLRQLLEHLRAGIVVGHNLSFDLQFVAYEARRFGFSGINIRYIDTLALARRIVLNTPNLQLRTLLRFFDLEPKHPLHTAVADAFATRGLFWRLIEEGGIETLRQAGLQRLNWSTS